VHERAGGTPEQVAALDQGRRQRDPEEDEQVVQLATLPRRTREVVHQRPKDTPLGHALVAQERREWVHQRVHPDPE